MFDTSKQHGSLHVRGSVLHLTQAYLLGVRIVRFGGTFNKSDYHQNECYTRICQCINLWSIVWMWILHLLFSKIRER